MLANTGGRESGLKPKTNSVHKVTYRNQWAQYIQSMHELAPAHNMS